VEYENKTLNERESTHGDYSVTAKTAQMIKVAIDNNSEGLSFVQRESLHLIATKIGRICSGDSNCKDHWDDIAGYSNLVSERLKNAQENNA